MPKLLRVYRKHQDEKPAAKLRHADELEAWERKYRPRQSETA